ncbi:MAG: hypothetical protein KIT84_16210 [Labilithrix sp.]|nr:hypothetical protein [Labilithrix sp.]MCW5812573.1 hypothetical protein [Labilithrix sp.]
MTTALQIVIGLVLGGLGAGVHLAITRWRVALAAERGAAAALVTMPLGLVALGVLVLIAARISPVAAWAAPAGLFAVRLAVLRRVRR